MKAINNYVVLTVFFYSMHVGCCSILNITADRFEVYHDIMMEIFRCHPNYKNVIFYDDLHHQSNIQFLKKMSFSAHLKMNSSTKYNNNEIMKIKKTIQIDAVIMTIYEPGFVRDFMVTLQSLQLIENTSPFYIFSRLRNSCYNRKVTLEMSSDLKLLSIFFICLSHPTDTPLIYTFNPYAQYAPKQWSLVPTLNKPNKPFGIFNRLFKKGLLCSGLDFDRTQYNNNSIMRFGVELSMRDTFHEQLQWQHFSHELIVKEIFHDNIILQLLKKSMKMDYEAVFISYPNLRRRGLNDVLKKANELNVDLIMFNEEVIDKPYYIMTYPYKITEYKIVAYRAYYQNIFEYIYYALGPSLLVGMGVFIAITSLVIWLSNKDKTIAFVFFEIIRLLISASLLARMNTAALKIFFMMMLFYFIIVQTLFQGNLATFFTNPPRKKFPNSLEQLETFKYKPIIVSRELEKYIAEYEYIHKNRMHIDYMDNCHIFIFSNIYKSTACIVESKLANFMEMMNITQQSQVVHKKYRFYLARHTSPIKNRAYKAFLQLWELGFSSLISERENSEYSGFVKRRTARFAFTWGPIKNFNFFMMYIFLEIGLLLGFICFVFELIIYNREKIRKYFLKKKQKKRNEIKCKEDNSKYACDSSVT